jgi:hypothetical protein
MHILLKSSGSWTCPEGITSITAYGPISEQLTDKGVDLLPVFINVIPHMTYNVTVKLGCTSFGSLKTWKHEGVPGVLIIKD